MKSFFPILSWLPDYRKDFFKNDLIAGFTVAVMLIPQGMAYALLAGLPPIMGLYAALVPLFVYPFLGTSRQLSVGPMAMDSLLVAAGISLLAEQGTPDYIMLAMALALVVGIIQFLMGLMRLGFLVNFLSQPVINGFTSAAAFIIGFSQVKHLLRVEFPGSQQIVTVIWRIIQYLPEMHLLTLLLGLGCLALMLAIKRWRPTWPGALIVIVISTFIVWKFDLHGKGVLIVGEVPQGLPSPKIPQMDMDKVLHMIPIAFTIALISFMEAVAIAKKIAAQKRYTIDANQELIALGTGNFFAGFLGGYPTGGSFSRTAVNVHAGAQTPLASTFNALAIATTLLFLTPLFYYLPEAALAAIVIVAVIGLVDVHEPFRLYKIRKEDAVVLIFAFFITLLLGVRNGILLSVLLSLIIIIRRISRPHVALLGRIPGTEILRNPKRAPNAEDIEGLVIFRIDASLYFANVSYLQDKIYESIEQRKSPVKALIIDASSINEIDAPAAEALVEIAEDLVAQNIELYFTNVKGPVRDIMKRAGLYQKLGRDHFFFSKKDAVRHYLGDQPEIPPQTRTDDPEIAPEEG